MTLLPIEPSPLTFYYPRLPCSDTLLPFYSIGKRTLDFLTRRERKFSLRFGDIERRVTLDSQTLGLLFIQRRSSRESYILMRQSV